MSKKTLHTLISFGLAIVLTALIGSAVFLWPKSTHHNATSTQEETATPQKVFDAKDYTLSNGMRVIVVENFRSPVVTHMVWYRVGAADETQGKSGIAHFLEHLMFKGSEGMAPGEFSKTIRALGGNDNAFTGQDYTAYFQSVAVEHLEQVMRMEAGRVRGLNVPLDEVTSERKVILEERRQRIDNNPNAKLSEQMRAALFINHPYGTPIIGWEHEMAELSWEDAKSFYDKWYTPSNAVLIVSGAARGDDVYAMADKIYGLLPASEVPERKRTISPPMNTKNDITLYNKAVRQPEFQRIIRLPSYHQNANESLALQVLEEILGANSSARLYKSLVIDQKIATDAGMSYDSSAWNDGQAYIYATPTPEHSTQEVREAIDAELYTLITEGISQQELDDAITRLQTDAIYARDSLTGPAMIIGYSLMTGTPLGDIEYWPDNIAKITLEDVRNVAAKYFNPDEKENICSIDGFLLPLDKEESAP